VLLLGMSALAGEPQRLSLDALTARSVLSLAYLVVFGSIVAFTAYTWLLTVATPAQVSTYAYVNPVVAVALGAAIGGEALTARTAVAAGVIIAGVAVIVTFTGKRGAGGGPNGAPGSGRGPEGAVAVAESA
jgi:drug/metabolite transporter (DMT)-like permease